MESKASNDPLCTCNTRFSSAAGAAGGASFKGLVDSGLANNLGQFNFALGGPSVDYGVTFGQSLLVTNQSVMATGNSGSNVSTKQMPQLLHLGADPYTSVDTYAVVAAGQIRYFAKTGEHSYSPIGPYQDALSEDSDHHEFVFSDSAGNSYFFHDLNGPLILQRGAFVQAMDAGGNTAKVILWEDPNLQDAGLPAAIQLTATVNNVITTDTFKYTYSAGENFNAYSSHEVSSVLLTREIDPPTVTGTPFNVEEVDYTYYPLPEDYIGAADLKLAEVQEPIGSGGAMQTVDTTYFRDDAPGELTYVFTNASYARLLALFGSQSVLDNSTTTDAKVAPYADIRVQYDNSTGSVTEVDSQGGGCSICSGGLGVFSYSFTTNTDNTPGYNSWILRSAGRRRDFWGVLGEVNR